MGNSKNRSWTAKKNKKARAMKAFQKKIREGDIVTKKHKERPEKARQRNLRKTPKQIFRSRSVLCSEHFPDNQYRRSTRRKGLIHDAVPSILPSRSLVNATEADPTDKNASAIPEKFPSAALLELQEKKKRSQTNILKDALLTPRAKQVSVIPEKLPSNALSKLQDKNKRSQTSFLKAALLTPRATQERRSLKQPLFKVYLVAPESCMLNEVVHHNETCDEEYITPDIIERDPRMERNPDVQSFERDERTNTIPKFSSTAVEVLDVEPDVWFLVQNLQHTGT